MSYDTLLLRSSAVSDTTCDPTVHDDDLDEILQGLALPQKRLPTRLLYDERGSRLFEQICDLPEYYVTRAELAILEQHAAGIAAFVGPDAALVEPGAGCGDKARRLLATLQQPRLYAPMDIDDAVLARCARQTRKAFPGLRVTTLHGDFLHSFVVPQEPLARRCVLFFPGSTIGNLDPASARQLLRRFHAAAGRGGRLLIGVDLRKNAATLRRAYDDAAGVTARFNLNLLAHLNRAFGADFDLEGFTHAARYDKQHHRIEMHLVSRHAQRVSIGRRRFQFAGGESIHTENSCKHLPSHFAALAASTGWQWLRLWLDPQRRFGLLGFQVAV